MIRGSQRQGRGVGADPRRSPIAPSPKSSPSGTVSHTDHGFVSSADTPTHRNRIRPSVVSSHTIFEIRIASHPQPATTHTHMLLANTFHTCCCVSALDTRRTQKHHHGTHEFFSVAGCFILFLSIRRHPTLVLLRVIQYVENQHPLSLVAVGIIIIIIIIIVVFLKSKQTIIIYCMERILKD